MIGLALSGGGSRAIAFHLGCLRALNDLDLLNQIGVISTISGGSIIGAYYAYTPDKEWAVFESEIRQILRKGFHNSIAFEIAKPANMIRCVGNLVATKIDGIVSGILKNQPRLHRFPSRTDMFHQVLKRDVYRDLRMNSPRRNDIEIVIGACELRTGSAFRFGNVRSGGWRYGEMVKSDVDVAFAVAASAAYPLFLPAFDRTWVFRKNGEERKHRVLITDGGVYDNLGIKVLEPGRNSEVSLHTYPCDFIISCNAGHGQDSGQAFPLSFLPRVSRSFEIVHRRVQDSAMSRLHQLKKNGDIKGFALPYLGQQDDRLPWKPSHLVPRSEVIGYPTNFAAMSDGWVDRLSERGEQLMRALISQYLPNIR